jgi:hypothetical protein
MYSAEQLMHIMLQGVPEYYGSKQTYQPTDVGSEIANMSLLEDQLNMAANPLFAILNGTFDYGLLEPQSSFDKEPPNTALLDQYTESGLLDNMLIALQEGYLPEQAAIAQYNAEFPNAADAISDERGQLLVGADANPRYKALLDTAKGLAPEVAEMKQYERQRANATFEPSEMAKTLQAMGISSELTPDSYFSDSIDKLTEDAFKASTEKEKAQKAWDLIGKELVGPTDAFDDVVEEIGLNPEVTDGPKSIQDSTSQAAKLIKEYQPPQTMQELDPISGQGLSRDWAQTPVQTEYEDIVPGLNDAGSRNPRITTYEQDEMAPVLAEMRGKTGSTAATNYGGNWRALDKKFEDSLETRKATPAERAAIRRATDKEYDTHRKQRQEQYAIDLERQSGRTIQQDQAMAMLANMFMRR